MTLDEYSDRMKAIVEGAKPVTNKLVDGGIVGLALEAEAAGLDQEVVYVVGAAAINKIFKGMVTHIKRATATATDPKVGDVVYWAKIERRCLGIKGRVMAYGYRQSFWFDVLWDSPYAGYPPTACTRDMIMTEEEWAVVKEKASR